MSIITTELDTIVASSPGADVNDDFFVELKNNLLYLEGLSNGIEIVSDAVFEMDGSVKTLEVTTSSTITLPDAEMFSGKHFFVNNSHSSTISIIPITGQTISGATDVTLDASKTLHVFSNGTNWKRVVL